MKRYSTLFFGLALAIAGCGEKDTGGDMGDAGGTVKPPDIAMEATPPDMTSTGLPTGEPCAKNGDCAKGLGPNQSATCTKSQMGAGGEMIVWPDGYCTSTCRMAKNDPNNNGINSDCPGGNATCQGNGGTGTCAALCQSGMDCRTGYGCFVVNNIAPLGCLPKVFSECDPAKAATCPRMCPDAGVPPAPDGGYPDGGGPAPGPVCYEQTCVNIGDGTVGNCAPGCDPFKNMGCPGANNDTDCHASDVTGEGLCTNACTSQACQDNMPAGSTCGNFFNDCPGGYGCLNGKCWKYCNKGNVGTQCSQGATCEKFRANSKVDTAVAGICSKSS